ncbi:hypothetical protein SO802_032391 [Lithocarpus litseifolius]|uniref:G domain-containing protein n=1 Tax=Lithocarpus litseifolius TaxID=425828 RepID=A0AAW2BNA8_9ROSI
MGLGEAKRREESTNKQDYIAINAHGNTSVLFTRRRGSELQSSVGPLPSVTQDINCWIAHQPSIYVLDIPGVLVPSIPDIETELKLALAGLNTRGTPLHWKHLSNKRLEGIQYDSKEKHEYNLKDLQPKRRKLANDSDMLCIEDIIIILLCFVYEEVFYGQAKKNEHVNLEMFTNARQDLFMEVQFALYLTIRIHK